MSRDRTHEMVERLNRDGYLIVEDVISPSFAAEIRAELDRLERERPGGDIAPAPFTGFHTRRWFDLLNDGDVWQRVAAHPPLLAVLEGALGPSFLLSTMGTAVIGPTESAQPIHCDDQIYAMGRPHKNLVCNTMWALDEFTEANGATQVVPASNHLDKDPDVAPPPPGYDTIPLTMPAGSVAFVLGSTYHGAGANLSDATRWALTINYCCGAMRQQENLMLAISPERMNSFEPRLRALLGAEMYNGVVGHIFAGDPVQELARRFDTDPNTARSRAPRSYQTEKTG